MTLELFEEWSFVRSLPLNFETYCRFVTEFREGELATIKVDNYYLREEKARLERGGDQAVSVAEAVRSVVNGTPVNLDEVWSRVQELHPHLSTSRDTVGNTLIKLSQQGQLARSAKIEGVLYRYTKAVAVILVMTFLSGCRSPEFQPVAQPSRKINWYADVEWPLSESPGVKTYHVQYGLHVNTMTNELVTSANHCRVYGLELGRTYYFSVRASDGKSYSQRTDIATFRTP